MSLYDSLFGRPLASREESGQKIGIWAGIPILGLDGLSSAAYGPEAALTILLPLGGLGLAYLVPVTGTILALLAILYFSYRQTITAYPNGGGSYIVARENLGDNAGLLAAAALMLDYVLNVSVGISAGVGALTSAFPALQGHTLAFCLGILTIITVVNLRGASESGVVFGVPTYLFIVSLTGVILWGLIKSMTGGGHPHPIIAPPPVPHASEAVGVWILLRSFASGCTAMTGVEAVSNGIGAFAPPATKRAQQTLTAIIAILGLMLAGIALLCESYHVGAMDESKPGYQSVLSQLVDAIAGRGTIYYVTMGSVLFVLALSANTSFAGFPRLCQMVAHDGFLPHIFAQVGRRLVYSSGIVILAVLAGLLLVVFDGITDRLIPLFAVGAFGAFTLSQAGMVQHWRKHGGRGSRVSLSINLVGAVSTALALAIILVAKFVEGAWVTIIIIPAAVLLFRAVKRHYDFVARRIACVRPLDLKGLQPPLVVVPIEGWNLLTEGALRFAMRISPEVLALHVDTEEDEEESAVKALRELWPREVEAPAREAGLTPPKLEIIDSPYRFLFRPLWDKIQELLATQPPDRRMAVIIPELVPTHWYEHLLHNHRAEGLKAALLFQGEQRIVVINVPWYTDARVLKNWPSIVQGQPWPPPASDPPPVTVGGK